MDDMHKMIDNHQYLFQLLAQPGGLSSVYNKGGFYSVMDKSNVYPKLTLCYHPENTNDASISNFCQAIENNLASPYVILPSSDVSVPLEKKLKQSGFRIIETWESMHLLTSNVSVKKSTNLNIVTVQSIEQLKDWITVPEKVLFNHQKLEIKLYEQFLSSNDVQLLLGYTNNEPVSTMLICKNAKTAGLYMIGTLEKCRGKGYGTEIVRFALQRVAQDGISECVLQATKQGSNMYKQLGFTENGKFLIYWKVGKKYV